MPATSLFSVLGDVPSQRVGSVVTWRAAPRLDLIGDLAVRRIDDDFAEEITGRARLRLDDRGTSSVIGELRRSGGDNSAWTGARAAARIALPRSLAVATELELVIPDDGSKGAAWPWALVAMDRQRRMVPDHFVAGDQAGGRSDRGNPPTRRQRKTQQGAICPPS